MASPLPSGNLVIRPCDVCDALVLHDERERNEVPAGRRPSAQRWSAFPHRVPGGAICIGGGKRGRASPQ